jgi:hypothetical protein
VKLEIRPFAAGDEVALQAALFELEVSLAKVHPAHPELPGKLMRPKGSVPSLERLRWMQLENPVGLRSLLLWDGERVAGHYSAIPQRVWLDGREVIFGELAQCFVLPQYRQGLLHKTPFVNLAESFFEAHGGLEGDMLYYGYPSYGEWRIGKKVLGYESLRLQALLVREPGPGSNDLPAGAEPIERFDEQARWLWDRCAGEFGALGIRDDAYLNWRFCDHPEQSYEPVGVRDGDGILRGYAVYAEVSWQGTKRATICDWLCPQNEPEVAEKLHAAMLALTRRDQAESLAVLLPERCAWHAKFQDWGHQLAPAETFLFGRVFQRRHTVLWLRDHWYYTLADTLLV